MVSRAVHARRPACSRRHLQLRLGRRGLLRWAAWLALGAGTAMRAADARATDALWEGNNYLQVPVRLGSDTRLVMPEAFDDAWERDNEVACTLLDSHTLIIRPRSAAIEQRLTLRGRQSGILYLARVSSTLPYTPIVTVHNAAPAPGEALSGRSPPTVIGLLKAMMQGRAPAGYLVARSQRVLFDQAPYRVVAQEVWHTRHQTGILAELSTARPVQPVPVVPANLFIRIPELGSLRALAADDFELDASRLSTRVYLVFSN